MDDSLKRNIAKIGMFAALSWIGYKIISGIASDKSSKEIAKETVAPITNAAAEVSKITKKFLKGSDEAKAHMAAIRAKIKPKDKVVKKNVKISSKNSKFKGEKSVEVQAKESQGKSENITPAEKLADKPDTRTVEPATKDIKNKKVKNGNKK